MSHKPKRSRAACSGPHHMERNVSAWSGKARAGQERSQRLGETKKERTSSPAKNGTNPAGIPCLQEYMPIKNRAFEPLVDARPKGDLRAGRHRRQRLTSLSYATLPNSNFFSFFEDQNSSLSPVTVKAGQMNSNKKSKISPIIDEKRPPIAPTLQLDAS